MNAVKFLLKGFKNKFTVGQLHLFNPARETSTTMGQQLNLFEGQVKQFGENDLRRLEKTKSGKLRWVDADKKEESKQTEQNADKKEISKNQPSQLDLFSQSETSKKEVTRLNTSKPAQTQQETTQSKINKQDETKTATKEQQDLFEESKDLDDEISKIASDATIARKIEQEMKDEGIEIDTSLTLKERVEKYLREKQKKNIYSKDVGERVGGAKKEMKAYQKFQIEKIDELLNKGDRGVAYKLATKNKIFENLNLEELKKQGYTPQAVFLIKSVIEALPSKPKEATAQGIRDYIKYVTGLISFIEKYQDKSAPELFERFASLFNGYSKFNIQYDFSAQRYPAIIIDPVTETKISSPHDSEENTHIAKKIQRLLDNYISGLYSKITKLGEVTESNIQSYCEFQEYKIREGIERRLREIAGIVESSLRRDFITAKNMISAITHGYRYIIFESPNGMRTIIKLPEKIAQKFKDAEVYESLAAARADFEYFARHVPLSFKKLPEGVNDLNNLRFPETMDKIWNELEDGKATVFIDMKPRAGDWSFLESDKSKSEEAESKNKERGTEGTEEGTEAKNSNKNVSEKGEKKSLTPPLLDMVIRKNGRAVADEDVKAENIRDKYGFKFVEFGHYVKDEEAKLHLKHFLASLKDLEDVLEIDLKSFIQGNGLSIAFGSRGSGKACAHYDPLNNIINLTKNRGNGTVAHEFGHFVDYAVNKILSEEDKALPTTKDKFRIKKDKNISYFVNYNNNGMKIFAKDKSKSPLIKAFDDVLRNIYNRDYKVNVIRQVSPPRNYKYVPRYREIVSHAKLLANNLPNLKNDLIKFYKEHPLEEDDSNPLGAYFHITMVLKDEKNEIRKYGILNILNSLILGNPKITQNGLVNPRKEPKGKSLKEFIEEAGGIEKLIDDFDPVLYSILDAEVPDENMAQYLAKEWGKPINIPLPTYTTQFVRNSEAAGEYYSKVTELFARAFESYVQDKLSQKQMINNYLVHNNRSSESLEGTIYEAISYLYPQGNERENINKAFDKLFNALRVFYPKRETSSEQRVDEEYKYEEEKKENLFKSLKEQLNLFHKPQEGETKQGKRHPLVFKRHRWHLSDEYNADGSPKGGYIWDKPAESSRDPDQLNLLGSQKEAPLSGVKQVLIEMEKIKNDIKESKYKTISNYLLKHAEKQKNKFLSDIDIIARQQGLDSIIEKFSGNALKSQDKIIEELRKREKQNINGPLSDVLRTTIVINSPKQLDSIKEALQKKGYTITKVDNRFNAREGYRDARIYAVYNDEDPVIKEIRLIQPNMLRAKESIGFDVEDIKDNINEVIPNLNDKPDIKSIIDTSMALLERTINEYYNNAYKADNPENDSQLSLDLAYPSPAKTSDSNKDLSSNSLEDIFKKSLRERFGKQIWQPIKAKLYASSSVMPDNAGLFNNSSNTDLISDSIIKPLVELFKKHNADYLIDAELI